MQETLEPFAGPNSASPMEKLLPVLFSTYASRGTFILRSAEWPDLIYIGRETPKLTGPSLINYTTETTLIEIWISDWDMGVIISDRHAQWRNTLECPPLRLRHFSEITLEISPAFLHIIPTFAKNYKITVSSLHSSGGVASFLADAKMMLLYGKQ
jgi:hypothetical protein